MVASFHLQLDQNTMADVVMNYGAIFLAFYNHPENVLLVPCIENHWHDCEQPLFILAFFLHPRHRSTFKKIADETPLAWSVVQVCDLLLRALHQRGHRPALQQGATVVGEGLTGLWHCGSEGAGRSPLFLGLRQVRVQGLALGSPGSGHFVHHHQYNNL